MRIKGTPAYYHEDNAIYFVTTHTKDFKQIFSKTLYFDILLNVTAKSQNKLEFILYAYCFLLNHFHLVIQPKEKDSISNIMHKIKGISARLINQERNKEGENVWENRSQKRMITSEKQFQQIVDYIHYNPIKHRLVKKPEDWRWSSYNEFVKRGYYEIGWGYSI